MTAMCDKPLAAKPFTSYRYRGRYGWIMIGAMTYADALEQAVRSFSEPGTPTLDNLEVWTKTPLGECYQPARQIPEVTP